MTSRTFFELQRVRAAVAASTAAATVRRQQFDRAEGGTPEQITEIYRQHRPEFITHGDDPIKRAYQRLGILYE